MRLAARSVSAFAKRKGERRWIPARGRDDEGVAVGSKSGGQRPGGVVADRGLVGQRQLIPPRHARSKACRPPCPSRIDGAVSRPDGPGVIMEVDVARHRHPHSHRLRWGMSVMLAVAALVGGWLYLRRDTFRVSVGQPGASSLLTEAAARSALPTDQAGLIETTDPDGTMPESATRVYRSEGPATAIGARVIRSCRALGLAPADEAMRSSEPSALCMGRWRDGFAVVSLRTRCGVRCETTVKVELA